MASGAFAGAIGLTALIGWYTGTPAKPFTPSSLLEKVRAVLDAEAAGVASLGDATEREAS